MYIDKRMLIFSIVCIFVMLLCGFVTENLLTFIVSGTALLVLVPITVAIRNTKE